VPGRDSDGHPRCSCPSWSCRPLQSLGVTRSSGAWVAAPAVRLPKPRCAVFPRYRRASSSPQARRRHLASLVDRPRRTRDVPEHPLVRFSPPAGCYRVALPASTGASHWGFVPSSTVGAAATPRGSTLEVRPRTVSTVCAGLLPRRLPGPVSSRERSWGFPGRASPRRRRRRFISDGKQRRVRSRHARGWLARRPFPPIVSSLRACRPSVMGRCRVHLSCAFCVLAPLRVPARPALQSLLHRRWSRSLWRARSPFEVLRHRPPLAARRLRRGSSSYRPTRRTIIQHHDRRQARRDLSTIDWLPHSARDFAFVQR
jgi:hypothetical protein